MDPLAQLDGLIREYAFLRVGTSPSSSSSCSAWDPVSSSPLIPSPSGSSLEETPDSIPPEDLPNAARSDVSCGKMATHLLSLSSGPRADLFSLARAWDALHSRLIARMPPDIQSHAHSLAVALLKLHACWACTQPLLSRRALLSTLFVSLVSSGDDPSATCPSFFPGVSLPDHFGSSWLVLPFLPASAPLPAPVAACSTPTFRQRTAASLANLLHTLVHQTPLPALLATQRLRQENSALHSQILALQTQLRGNSSPFPSPHPSPSPSSNPLLFPGDRPVLSLGWSSDAALLAWSAQDGRTRVLELVPDAPPNPRTLFHVADVLHLDWHDSNHLLCVASRDRKLQLWNPVQQRVLSETVLEAPARALRCSPGGGALLAVALQQRVVMWSWKSGTIVAEWAVPRPLTSLVMNHNGSLVMTGDEQGRVRVYDCVKGSVLLEWSVGTAPVATLALGVDETSLWTGTLEEAQQWDLRPCHTQPLLQRTISMPSQPLNPYSFSVDPTDEFALITGSSSSAAQIHLQDGSSRPAFKSHSAGAVTHVACSPAQRWLASVSSDASLLLQSLI